MIRNVVVIFILFVQTLGVRSYNYDEKPKPKPNSTDWDVIVFTQRWPITACSQWLKSNVSHSCSLPSDSNIWTVHGVWPTKSGTRGPWNCNKTRFNETLLASIKAELEQHWINIENDTKLDSFWEHEWQKHGTCAQILPALNTELKYFSKGLEWNKIYNLHDILTEGNVAPSASGYTIERIYETLKNSLGRNPIVQCVVDKQSKESLLSEVQVCFDRSFNLIDCDPVKALFYNVDKVGNILTDCSQKKVVVYPSRTLLRPTVTEDLAVLKPGLDVLLESRSYWIRVYKTIKFLLWSTI